MPAKDELEKLDREWMEEERRHGSIRRMELISLVSWLFMMVGFALVILGVWLFRNQPLAVSEDWSPLPEVCMISGVFLVLGSLAFMLSSSARIGAYNKAKWNYGCRRKELLQGELDETKHELQELKQHIAGRKRDEEGV